MSRYIPPNDGAFLAWLNNFLERLDAYAESFGLDDSAWQPLAEARDALQARLTEFQSAAQAYRAASQARRTARRAAEQLARALAQHLQHHPAMTNALRAELGLTIPRTPVRRRVGVEVPGVRLEVDAGRVLIHFGTNPEDERRNGKPEWAIGANIYIRAEDEAEYRLLAFDTASPYVWEYRGAPKRFYVRVAYRGRREQDVGAPSPEQVVSVGA